MTKQAWTQGPWQVEGDDPAELIIWSSPENRVCFLAHSAGFNDDGDFANAHLIAAAPEMFEAHEKAPIPSQYHGKNGFDVERFLTDYDVFLGMRRAALSKAQGIPPESPLWEGE